MSRSTGTGGCCRQKASSAAGRRGWSRRSTITNCIAGVRLQRLRREVAFHPLDDGEPARAKQLLDLPIARPDQRDTLIQGCPTSLGPS